MKAVIQRASKASVSIEQQEVGKIERGLVVLLGVHEGDTQADVDYLVKKVAQLRIFEDEQGKMNRSIEDIQGELLSISQFTLFADTKKGNRPSFIEAGAPDEANRLYEYIISEAKKQVSVVEHGIFGADMKVSLENDGPFTVIFDEHLKG